MVEIPTVEPKQIVAGDCVQWKISLADYPASDSFVLSYLLSKTGTQIKFDAATDGDDHLISLAAATTALYTAGSYNWSAYVTKSSQRITVRGKGAGQGSGYIEILPNYVLQTSGYDGRSHVIIGHVLVLGGMTEIAAEHINALFEPNLVADIAFSPAGGTGTINGSGQFVWHTTDMQPYCMLTAGIKDQFGLKRIEQKLDQLIEAQQITARMLTDLIERTDDRRQAAEARKKALANYVDSVSTIMEAKGAPAQFINSFKQLFDKGFKQ